MWRYVKSGYGGPPSLWRPLHPAQHGAGQSDSHAPAGYAGFRLPPLALQYSQSPIPKISPSPITAPACVPSGLSRFLQANRARRASPPLLASRCSTVIRCYRKSGKSPCRCTGKAIIQIVARLCRAPASNQPQKTPIHQPENKPGQGSRTATLRRLRSLPTAAPRSQAYINSNSQADAKADYRIRSTNIIPVPQKKRP